MANNIKFNYLNRDFESLKADLRTYIQVNYPEQYNDFAEATVGMMFLELNAYVGDILSYHVDTKFNELFLDSAVNRKSVIQLARNLGYNPRGRIGSTTLLNVSIDVPVLGDTYDENYLITIETGFRASSANGTVFEIREPINFADHYSLTGIINRTIVPNYNNSNEIISYKVTKTLIAQAGETVIKTLEVTNDKGIPYLKWIPDEDDTSIINVQNLVSTATRHQPVTESDWDVAGSNLVWHEMDSLAQERVFIDTTVAGDYTEGYWHYTAERFITEYDEFGRLQLTFGAGVKDVDNFDYFINNGMSGLTPASLLNNDSLGSIPEPGTFLQVRYKSGGGFATNAGMNTIRTVDHSNVSYIPGGAALPIIKVNEVLSSIAVNNIIPAIGGRDFETVEEIKQYSKKHFSSQDRCVTIDDYTSRVQLLPPEYGNVFRSHAEADPESMNTALYILTRDENGLLKNTDNDTIKLNLANYLSQYKLLNDFINIYDGRIINIGINFTLQIQASYNKKEVLVNAMNSLKKYFSISNWNMNETIFISQINEMLREQPGVTNVVQLEFVNKVGGDYSTDILSINSAEYDLTDIQRIAESGEVVISPVNNSIKAPITGMIEIKYPTRDIKGAAI